MWVRNFLKLYEWGFNVPIFIENPCSGEYKDSAISALRDKFAVGKKFCILAEKGGHPRIYTDLKVDAASLFCSDLDHDGFDVVVFGVDKWEFSGKVVFGFRGKFECSTITKSGSICKCAGYDVDRASKIPCRFRLRELSKIREKVGFDDLTIFFAWCDDFTGVNNSKLVIYNFLNHRNSLDNAHPFPYIIC